MPLPAGIWAVRLVWNDSGYSIGETYYNSQAWSGIGTGLYAAALNLMKARTAMMGAGVIPVSGRMSLIGQRRAYYKLQNSDVSPIPPGTIQITVNPAPAFAGANPSNVVDGSAAQGPDAILVDAYGTLPQYHAKKYLAGCPNVLIRTNPNGPFVAGDAAWGNLFNAYATLLTTATNGWVMKVRTFPTIPAAPPIPTYALDLTNTYLTVTCPTLPGTVTIGTLLQILGAKMMSRAYKPPNGKWAVGPTAPVTSGGNTTYSLVLPFAVRFPYLLAGFGTVQVVDYSASTYTAVGLGREGEHKRGNSGLVARGRRRVVQQIAS
jgi:hypothetical protein